MVLTFGDIIAALALIITVISIFFAIFQWKKSIALQRTKFIYDILDKFQCDRDMSDAFYLVSYSNNWYINFHTNSENEYKIDKLLLWLTYVCYLIETGNIKDNELNIVDYTLCRVLRSKAVKEYLKDLNNITNKRKIKCPYYYLILYGVQNNILHTSDYPQQ